MSLFAGILRLLPLVVVFAGCESERPATHVGETLDRAGTATGQAVGNAAQATGRALNRTGDYINQQVNPAPYSE